MEAARASQGVDNHWLLKVIQGRQGVFLTLGCFGWTLDFHAPPFLLLAFWSIKCWVFAVMTSENCLASSQEEKSLETEKNSMGFHSFPVHLYITHHVLTSAWRACISFPPGEEEGSELQDDLLLQGGELEWT